MSVVGRVHSVESCGTVDGPGVRFVVFLQGCTLKCLYCHNADTRNIHGGYETTAAEVFDEIRKYKTFMKASGGGVTLTGGEPLLQPDFTAELLHLCKNEGIHTAIDTSGRPRLERVKLALDLADLILLDIKSYDPEIYQKVTSAPIEPTLDMARYLSESGKKMWIRFVLVPSLTDAPHNVEGVAKFTSELKTVERVQILPFHKMGEYKWESLGMKYELRDFTPPSIELLDSVKAKFRSYGLEVT